MIQVLSALESMRRRPEMFLDLTLERDVAIALQLLATAMHQGVGSLTVQKHAGLRVIGAEAIGCAPMTMRPRSISIV